MNIETPVDMAKPIKNASSKLLIPCNPEESEVITPALVIVIAMNMENVEAGA